MLTDGLALASLALETADIPPERILWARSLGTGVAISLTHHLTLHHSPPILFADIVLVAGTVLVTPFAIVELLARTYEVAGIVPLLSSM